MDMEFPRELNKAFDWDIFWPEFKTLLFDVHKSFCEKLGEDLQEPPKLLVLDSTTSEKFSKHIIAQTTTLFPNNRALKPLIAELCEKMRQTGDRKSVV